MRRKQGRDLVHRILIEQEIETKDNIGGPILSWISFFQVYAEVKPIRGVEFIAGQSHQNSVTHRIIIRHIKGVNPNMRVVHKGRTLNIEAVRDFGEREIWIELMCKELI